jgi:hypothetical protein
MLNSTRIFGASLIVLAAGCASSGASGAPAATAAGSAAQQSRGTQRSSRDLITAEELATVDVQNAYQAVQRLRPNFLQRRGTTSMTQQADIVVYVDNNRMGGPTTLQQIPTNEVKEIRYLSATDATQRYGTGHAAGAIVVTRK